MSQLLALAERFVAAVKRGVDNGASPHQILHEVAGIRNEVRGLDLAPLVPAEVSTEIPSAEPVKDGEDGIVTLADRVAKATGKELAAIADEHGLVFPKELKTVVAKRDWLGDEIKKLEEPADDASSGTQGGSSITFTNLARTGTVTVSGEGSGSE